MKLILLLPLLLTFYWGCASQTATEEAKKAPATRYDQGTDGPTQSTSYIPCGQSSQQGTQSKYINGNSLYVTTSSNQRASLCQVLQQSGKSVAIFQFSGLLCQSCQDEAKFVNRQQLNNIGHHLVFTDDKSDIDPSNVQNFRSLAPRSGFLYDSDKVVANDLNPGQAFGTVLVLHQTGEYKLYLSPGLEQTWFFEAQKMSRKSGTSNQYNNSQYQGSNTQPGYNQYGYGGPDPQNQGNSGFNNANPNSNYGML